MPPAPPKLPPVEAIVDPPLDVTVVPPLEAAVVPPFDATVVPPLEAAVAPPLDVTVVPPLDVAVVPPLDVAVVPPLDAAVVPPFDAAVVPPFDVIVVPPFDVTVVPPLEEALVAPPALTRSTIELPLSQPRTEIATIRISFLMGPSYLQGLDGRHAIEEQVSLQFGIVASAETLATEIGSVGINRMLFILIPLAISLGIPRAACPLPRPPTNSGSRPSTHPDADLCDIPEQGHARGRLHGANKSNVRAIAAKFGQTRRGKRQVRKEIPPCRSTDGTYPP